ncbi:MAG: UDP-N-acetylmuramoyl-tripeptide--D-alanyl-D-alanine ligase [Eubacteriaceae bacterium]|jgi:UDP-N-acetylmuramoyl-tripeptide--D-alanyl-D-alanine ligase|nr:UDP-N-acetylmuramoyl-tripeptide--D-alanyl-D-alanine ligase [Eubacteriaceae bacterium]
MIPMRASDIAGFVGGEVAFGDGGAIADNIVTDSRKARKGSCFFALKGEATNGELFLSDAFSRGAAIAVVANPDPMAQLCQITVRDPLKALQDLARAYIERFPIPFVAVTGSSGKTTTKELLATILSQKYKTAKSPGNLNSQTGVPLSIFGLAPSDEIGVFEISMSHPGEILANVEILRPQTVIITNIGVAHIEFLGSRENIYLAKKESLAFLGESCAAIVNGEDDMLCSLEGGPFEVIKAGVECGDFTAANVSYGAGGSDFYVDLGGKAEHFRFPLAGRHFVLDALLAIAAAWRHGLGAEEIQQGLASFEASDSRMDSEEIGGVTLLNDTYNANPESMKASLDTLAILAKGGRAAAVLGDMFELGERQWELTKEVGRHAARRGIGYLAVSGNTAEAFAEGYGEANGNGVVFASSSYEAIASSIAEWLKPGDAALFKASRGMAFEGIYSLVAKRLR